jgi:gluconolactonase
MSQTVCGTFQFKYNYHDGPTWIDSENAFFFSDYAHALAGPSDIIKYTPGGQCETWLADAGCNGLSVAYDGTLIAVCQTSRSVLAFNLATKQPKTLASMYMGQMLDSPNDVVAHSSGSIFFTNPSYELGARPLGFGPAIFYIDPGGTLNLIAKTPSQPNGIALSPDEKHVYVEVDGTGTRVFDLDATGAPSSGLRNFAGGADGLSVDCAGNVYLSGGAIISPAGMQIGTFGAGSSMAVLGGADHKTLFVLPAMGPPRTVQMNVPGPPH